MAKVAVDLNRALAERDETGSVGRATPRIIARGDGWTVADVICTSGPHERPFEERHRHYCVAMVVAGTFEYWSPLGRALLTPGAAMLGNPGLCYECGHEHAPGDRCVSFWYAPEYFERLGADAGARRVTLGVPRLPPLRALAPLVARAANGLVASDGCGWEELGLDVAAQVLRLANDASADACDAKPRMVARVTEVVRQIAHAPDATLTLGRLAKDAGVSPYHFLRTFERLTGVTPHQYILRARLRDAALRLASEPGKVLDIALDCGFGDVSNFTRTFRAEFGLSPRQYRATGRQ